MATAKKLPSGSWRVRVYAGRDPSGKPVYQSFTGPTKREAERQAAVWNANRHARHPAASDPSVRQALDAYINTCQAAGMSPATIRAYNALKNGSYPLIADVRLSRLTSAMIQAQVDDRAVTYAPKTLRNELGLLRSAVSRYRKDLDFDDVILPRRKNTEMTIPTDDQVRALLVEVERDDNMYIAVMLAALMGLRRSEICALEWGDVDEQSKTLHVSKALVRGSDGKHYVKPPKTDAGDRYLPIPDAMFSRLMARRNTSTKPVNLSPNAITERYERLRNRLGIPGRFHDLRHYHASVMLAVGAPEKYIVADMGHSSFDMVRKVYGHVMETRRREIAQGLADHSSQILRHMP